MSVFKPGPNSSKVLKFFLGSSSSNSQRETKIICREATKFILSVSLLLKQRLNEKIKHHKKTLFYVGKGVVYKAGLVLGGYMYIYLDCKESYPSANRRGEVVTPPLEWVVHSCS